MASRGESSALWDGVGLGENNAENKGEDEKQTHFVFTIEEFVGCCCESVTFGF